MNLHVAIPLIVAAVSAVGFLLLPTAVPPVTAQAKAAEICRAVLWASLIGFFVNFHAGL